MELVHFLTCYCHTNHSLQTLFREVLRFALMEIGHLRSFSHHHCRVCRAADCYHVTKGVFGARGRQQEYGLNWRWSKYRFLVGPTKRTNLCKNDLSVSKQISVGFLCSWRGSQVISISYLRPCSGGLWFKKWNVFLKDLPIYPVPLREVCALVKSGGRFGCSP